VNIYKKVNVYVHFCRKGEWEPMKTRILEWLYEHPEWERRWNRVLMAVALTLPVVVVIIAAAVWAWKGGGR
jgi:hypothetical protein